MSGAPAEAGGLAASVVDFTRALRRAGLPVGPASTIDAIRSIEAVGLADRAAFYWALHATLVTRHDQSTVFDLVFERFWAARLAEVPMEMGAEKRSEPPPPGALRAAEAQADRRRDEEPEIEADAREALSSQEVLRRKDFAQMSAAELAEARRAIAALTLSRDLVTTRRQVAAHRGAIDPRRTLRASMRVGGDLLLPHYRAPAQIRPPIVALCDISGSMSQYTRMMLHFLHALGDRRRVDSFVFGTRLTNITRQLRRRDPDEALALCTASVEDWSGGTRIADALRRFNRDWSRRVLGQGAIVLLITDGLERDDPSGGADLAAEAALLRRSCRRLVWLNPLLRFESFEAKARGIRAMLPHVDEFRPVHSLAAVADLVAALSGEGGGTGDPQRYRAAA